MSRLGLKTWWTRTMYFQTDPDTYTLRQYNTLGCRGVCPDVRWCDCCHTSRGEVLGVVR